MLDPNFGRRLETDSRTLWARQIDDEQLAGLIWALGDFSGRSQVLTEQLDDHRGEIDPDDTEFARARTLLQRLTDLVNAGRVSAPDWPPPMGKVWQPIADALGPRPDWTGQTGLIFTGEFRRRLDESKGKYFPWAWKLTEDHFFAILATIGELAPLNHKIAAHLDRHQAEVFACIAYKRAASCSRDGHGDGPRHSRATRRCTRPHQPGDHEGAKLTQDGQLVDRATPVL